MIKNTVKKLLYYLIYYKLRDVKRFENIHEGEECYIFGGGNSLKYMDFRYFKDRKSIVMNYLPFHNDFKQLDCVYATLIAPFFFSKYLGKYPDNFKKHQYLIALCYKKLIEKNKDVNFFMSATNFFYVGRNNLTNVFAHFPGKKKSLSEEIDCFTGGLRFSVALANYMGFSRVYLVGCDYTFEPARHHHWFEKGNGLIKNIESYEKKFFDIVQKHVEIKTVTLNGTSKVLPSVTYKELTGIDPLYRENSELMDSKYLKILKQWPEFSID